MLLHFNFPKMLFTDKVLRLGCFFSEIPADYFKMSETRSGNGSFWSVLDLSLHLHSQKHPLLQRAWQAQAHISLSHWGSMGRALASLGKVLWIQRLLEVASNLLKVRILKQCTEGKRSLQSQPANTFSRQFQFRQVSYHLACELRKHLLWAGSKRKEVIMSAH